MLMEQHKWGAGTILFRQMFSAESLTSPHPGFPELFQTGETYHGQQLVDHQHPHNLFAKLAMLYTLPVTEKISWNSTADRRQSQRWGRSRICIACRFQNCRWLLSAITCRIRRIQALEWSRPDL
jgi:hypothetical protein